MENQNVTVVAEPVQIAGGDAPASFDELDRLIPSKPEPRATPKEEKVQAKEEPKPEKEVKSKDEPKVEAKESKDAAKQDAKEKAPEDAKAQEALAKEIKHFKLKSGDQETEVRSDALVPVKIAGKTEMVSLQDVVNNYSGATHLNRQYAEFKKERETFDSHRTDLNTAVATAHDLLVGKKDLRGFVEYVAEAMGGDPKAIYADMMAKMEASIEQYAQMSPEDRKRMRAEEELSYYRQREETNRAQKAEAKQKEAKQQTLKQVLETHNVDIDTFESRYKELSKLGSYKEEEITPEMVVTYHKNMVTFDTVDKLITQYAPELENKDKEIERIAALSIQTQATPEEIEAVVKQLYDQQAEKKLSKLIDKKEKKSKSEIPVRDPQSAPTFFEEL
mgnify:CR=1 FL=1